MQMSSFALGAGVIFAQLCLLANWNGNGPIDLGFVQRRIIAALAWVGQGVHGAAALQHAAPFLVDGNGQPLHPGLMGLSMPGMGTRMRRRGRLSRLVQQVFNLPPGVSLRDYLSGRWSDLTLGDHLNAHGRFIHSLVGGGLGVIGGGLLEYTNPENGLRRRSGWARVAMGEDIHDVHLEMLSRLLSFACYKPRTQELLNTLRLRGLEFAKREGMNALQVSLLLPGTLALAMVVTDNELAGARTMVQSKVRDRNTRLCQMYGGQGLNVREIFNHWFLPGLYSTSLPTR